MTEARHIVSANHSFSLKGSSDELLEAAKVAYKVKDKPILKEIVNTLKSRKTNRETKNKPPNQRLNRYLKIIEGYYNKL